MFTYKVEGDKESLEAFHEAQEADGISRRGKGFVSTDNDGNAIWNSFRYVGDSVNLVITANGRVVANDLDHVIKQQQETEQLERMEFAKIAAQARYNRQFGGIRRNPAAAALAADLASNPIAAPSNAAPIPGTPAAQKVGEPALPNKY